MKTFEKILCPIDFSENSVKALQWTQLLAKKHGSQVSILHVLEPYPALVDAGIDYDRYHQAMVRNMAEFLAPLKIKYQSILSTGYAAQKILTLAKSVGATAVVMGTRGLKGAVHSFMGSTTETVVRSSRIPVMTISPNAITPKEKPEEQNLLPVSSLQWPPNGYIRLRNVLRNLGGRFSILHVIDLKDPMFGSSFGANPLLVTTYETAERKQELTKLGLRIAGSQQLADSIIQFGDAAEEILKEAATRRYDFLVMAARKRTLLTRFLASTVYRVISSSPVPVITVRTS